MWGTWCGSFGRGRGCEDVQSEATFLCGPGLNGVQRFELSAEI